jgi:hypothetical protein
MSLTSKSNVHISPRIQEFIEKSQQQKLLVGLLVMDRHVYSNIDSGLVLLPKVDLFPNSDPNYIFDNAHEISLHDFLAPCYQLARSPRLEYRLEDFHAKVVLHATTYGIQMA